MEYMKKLTSAGVLLLIVASFYLLVLGLNAIKERQFIGGGVPVSNVITVSGSGEVLAVPDIATFTFTVEEEAKTVPEAQRRFTRLSRCTAPGLE